ncbi:Inositol-1,4,5-trisphosphate 5-phosphatase 1 [Emydomyces testavorans]|uniref:phosphoinositide 5-phosphatase n=1 Tax=Emydomyces testavorans TaxID=2070801 RepID=A0AAF0DL00_9EURO|nr:Inositol-1,4,5-trisphosphate 5-phosphatase 1 [Emydomyces testavorans]
MSLRVLCKDHPQRSIVLVTADDHALTLEYSPTVSESVVSSRSYFNVIPPRCIVKFSSASSWNLQEYRVLGTGYGTLGLLTLDSDVFLCVVASSSRVASPRPSETVQRIENVEFYCLNRPDYDSILRLYEDSNTYGQSADDGDYGTAFQGRDIVTENPFLALKKLLSDGSFYYSTDFNLTNRMQDRVGDVGLDIESLDKDLLWNSYMIGPLFQFRSRLDDHERQLLDSSRILTLVIRGFVQSMTIPATSPPLKTTRSNLPSTLTLISRLSSRRAGTRFNSRGIDDDGQVSNFVETETILWIPSGITFSYTQVRGSVPIFWEQTPGLIPGQQKIQVTRSVGATQHAFDKHFESLQLDYGATHVINLLSETKPGEVELSERFRYHIRQSPLRVVREKGTSSAHHLLRWTDFDFHAETRGPAGYGNARLIEHKISSSTDGFAYFLSEDPRSIATQSNRVLDKLTVILQQEGVFRTNCLDCLDRTNLVQTMISHMVLQRFFMQNNGTPTDEFWMRHSTLWADNGDNLSKIYAGTGALKSSFTRHGKMSLAGAIADAKKSVTRLYVNNFTDNARQNTIDVLLGALTGQAAVHLYDPVNDLVRAELAGRFSEFSSTKTVRLWVGTFNVNGRLYNASEDLGLWLHAHLAKYSTEPTIVAVGFQEIVDLSPQQIMSTDPGSRKVWEEAVKKTLDQETSRRGTSGYVLLRSGQLVGAALLLFAKEDVLKEIKNVEGSVKKVMYPNCCTLATADDNLKTGMSGIAGNKGGCAIRLEYANTSICFVTAHLAAGFSNYEERNRDYNTIAHGLRFPRNLAINDHDAVIWLGDFNYRIGLNDDSVRTLIQSGDLETLYENDQVTTFLPK